MELMPDKRVILLAYPVTDYRDDRKSSSEAEINRIYCDL